MEKARKSQAATAQKQIRLIQAAYGIEATGLPPANQLPSQPGNSLLRREQHKAPTGEQTPITTPIKLGRAPEYIASVPQLQSLTQPSPLAVNGFFDAWKRLAEAEAKSPGQIQQERDEQARQRLQEQGYIFGKRSPSEINLGVVDHIVPSREVGIRVTERIEELMTREGISFTQATNIAYEENGLELMSADRRTLENWKKNNPYVWQSILEDREPDYTLHEYEETGMRVNKRQIKEMRRQGYIVDGDGNVLRET